MDADLMGLKEDSAERSNKDDTEKDATKLELHEVELTKAEMRGIREENVRLKAMLQQIENDYKALQTQFINIFNQESNKDGSSINPSTSSNGSDKINIDDDEHELVSLRLGTTRKEENDHVIPKSRKRTTPTDDEDDGIAKLGLELNFEGSTIKNDTRTVISQSPDKNCGSLTLKNGNDEDEDEAAGDQIWPPGKMLKTQRSSEDHVHNGKRVRVCVRARCDTPTMNDGCQWRKYGQKIAKGNPCPRAYYRCTVGSSCPVRKQVQRCLEDMSILITTYEGTHNHPLPISATTMASTTSAAASMLLSGSSTSLTQPPPYYVPNSSPTPLPTITLDLTTHPSSESSSFGLYSSSFRTPRISPTSLSFSTLDSSNMIPTTVWGSAGSYEPWHYNSYHSLQQGRLPQGQNYQTAQTLFEKINQASSPQAITETLTKVITADPSFQSVIAAAISSMAGNGVGAQKNHQ